MFARRVLKGLCVMVIKKDVRSLAFTRERLASVRNYSMEDQDSSKLTGDCYSEARERARVKSFNRRTQALLNRLIRVDHAGEFAAVQIYAGQHAVLASTPVGPKIEEMGKEEEVHLKKFEELIPKYGVRPTALIPIWRVAGFALGAGTALLGKEAAMACTVAVETTIGEHYNSQLRELMENSPTEHQELLQTIRQFRDEELEHLDTGLEHGAEQAPFYKALSNTIQTGCKAAIWISERI